MMKNASKEYKLQLVNEILIHSGLIFKIDKTILQPRNQQMRLNTYVKTDNTDDSTCTRMVTSIRVILNIFRIGNEICILYA